MSLASPFACPFVGMAVACSTVAAVGHNMVVAGPIGIVPLTVVHIVAVAGPIAADHIVMAAIVADLEAAAHTAAEVAIVDNP